MKTYSRIALLAAIALFLTMTACNRVASTAPVASPTAEGEEMPFPVGTSPTLSNVAEFGTQTAIAQAPQGEGTPPPQVDVNIPTETQAAPVEGEQPTVDQEQGGGQAPEQQVTEAPPAPTALPANTPVLTRPETYTLQRGEWPICIARRYDLDLASFLALNGMNMNSEPGAGTVLRIPSSGNWSAGPRALQAHPTTYTVSATDTVYTIACRFGDVAPESILAHNNLSQPSDIKPGMTINIP